MDPARVLLAMHFGNPIFKGLKHLAKAIGISRIVLAHRTADDNVQGLYFSPVISAKSIAAAFEGWALSEGQKASILATLAKGDAAILVNLIADDPAEILRHEIGHHIARWICGLGPIERLIDPVTKAMREDPRLDEYCLQNRDEAYAEAFSLYLSGQPMRKINLRPMLRRACMNDTRSFSLLRNYRKSVA